MIPQDATLLVVAGPKSDFFPSEVDLLKGYLAKGGKVLFLLDPRDKADAPQLTNVTALLKDWGIGVDDDVVINVPSDYTVKEKAKPWTSASWPRCPTPTARSCSRRNTCRTRSREGWAA